MKRPYHVDHDPPAPFLSVQFVNSELDIKTDILEGLVDTGADTTIVPIKFLDQIESRIEASGHAEGQWGGSREINVHIVDAIVEGIVFPSVIVAGDEIDEEVVIGRDLLNRMKLVLDGLKQQTEITGY